MAVHFAGSIVLLFKASRVQNCVQGGEPIRKGGRSLMMFSFGPWRPAERTGQLHVQLATGNASDVRISNMQEVEF